MSFVVLFDISLPIVVHVTITDGRHHLVEWSITNTTGKDDLATSHAGFAVLFPKMIMMMCSVVA